MRLHQNAITLLKLGSGGLTTFIAWGFGLGARKRGKGAAKKWQEPFPPRGTISPRHSSLLFLILFLFPFSPLPSEARAPTSLQDGIEVLVKQLERGVPGQGPFTVFVREFEVEGASRGLGREVADRLKRSLAHSPRFRVVATMPGADGIVSGVVAGRGSNIVVEARIVELETSKTLTAASTTVEAPAAPPIKRRSAATSAEYPRSLKITARDYLMRGDAEAGGYGLYSYIVIPKRAATEEEFNTYVSLFKAYREGIEPVSAYRRLGADKSDLNITYWPLADTDRAQVKAREKNSDWRFFVQHYDYARAQVILSHLARVGQQGPFIISYVVPIAGFNVARRPGRDETLVIDLSRIQDDEYAQMFQYYQQKVAGAADTWTEIFAIEKIRLGVRALLLSYAKEIVSLVPFTSKASR